MRITENNSPELDTGGSGLFETVTQGRLIWHKLAETDRKRRISPSENY